MADKISLHPKIDPGIQPAAKNFAGGDLICQCASDPVRVSVKTQSAHNHACGCTSVGSRKAHYSQWWRLSHATS